MRTVEYAWVCLVAGLWLVGCEDPRVRLAQRLGPAKEIVQTSMDNLGWSRSGAELRSARFTAIVTTYDQTGKSYTDRQEMLFELAQDKLTTVGGTPQGRWKASIDDDGRFRLRAEPPVDRTKVQARMAPALATLLHRLRGPYNLLDRQEHARSAERTSVGGHAVVRVGVDGDNRQAVAYYFDAASGILRLVAAGADRAGAEGTVTEYQYDSHPNGMLFPSRIKVCRIGEQVLVGQTPVFEVELSEVKF
jgi:hypothetical protein